MKEEWFGIIVCNPVFLDAWTTLKRKNLCFIQFNQKIHWNTRLATSDVFHMFTQFLPAANLNLNYFWTAWGMNLTFYGFSQLLLEIILLEEKKKKKIENFLKFSGGNIFPYRGCSQKIGVGICRNSFSCRNKYLHV